MPAAVRCCLAGRAKKPSVSRASANFTGAGPAGCAQPPINRKAPHFHAVSDSVACRRDPPCHLELMHFLWFPNGKCRAYRPPMNQRALLLIFMPVAAMAASTSLQFVRPSDASASGVLARGVLPLSGGSVAVYGAQTISPCLPGLLRTGKLRSDSAAPAQHPRRLGKSDHRACRVGSRRRQFHHRLGRRGR
jgi:hypothetical protein